MEHISRLTDPLEGRIHPIDRRLKDSYSFFTIADQVLGINCSEKPLLAKKQEFRGWCIDAENTLFESRLRSSGCEKRYCIALLNPTESSSLSHSPGTHPREGFPAKQQFFHTNLASRRCYCHNNRYTIGTELSHDSVDKSSWESSACYPRRTFDPLSESPSTRDSRITMADFCLCSTSRRHLPQINYPPCSVPPPPEFSMRRLGTLRRKSGLSGLPLVLRIFTENSISLGPRRRQRGSRYTIRAGRYLCDKEFCYLRTVRVTAAVYRGFHSKLITLLLLTFQHRAGVRLYTSCYHLAESCVFNKQSLPPGMCRFPNQKIGEHPFSRSYGVILPSSFDMVLSSALVYSTCSPVSVWGTVSSPGGSPSQFEVFSWKFQPS
ncbi:hypothetical protein YC2023_050171 [Brassica napus]